MPSLWVHPNEDSPAPAGSSSQLCGAPFEVPPAKSALLEEGCADSTRVHTSSSNEGSCCGEPTHAFCAVSIDCCRFIASWLSGCRLLMQHSARIMCCALYAQWAANPQKGVIAETYAQHASPPHQSVAADTVETQLTRQGIHIHCMYIS